MLHITKGTVKCRPLSLTPLRVIHASTQLTNLTATNEVVKCDPMDDGAAYETQFIMGEEEAKQLHQLCMEAWKNARAMDKEKVARKAKPIALQKDEETGEIIGKAKPKGAYGSDKTQPPKQVDAKRNTLPSDFMLTTGSRINLAVTVVPYNTGSVNGVTLRLRSVQVIELAESEASDPFSEVDGYVIGGASDDFAGVQNNTASNAPDALEDDEIPW